MASESECFESGHSFFKPVSSDTLTIPSTASRVVTVGAYDARSFSYADFSGRGALEKNAEMWVQKPILQHRECG